MDQKTEQFANEQQFLEVLKQLDPQLFFIKSSLLQTRVNPDILPRIIRALGNLNIGTGYGEIMILVKERTVTQIKSNESDILRMNIDSEPKNE